MRYVLSIVITSLLLLCSRQSPGRNIPFLREDSVSIIKPFSPDLQNFSGDEQYGTVSSKLTKPVRVKVLCFDSIPVQDYPVFFEVLTVPDKAEGFTIEKRMVRSDSKGIAVNYITLGTKPGDYEIAVKIRSGKKDNFLVYRFHARKSNWVVMLVIGVLGGLGLFIFGMSMMSDGMQKSAGDRMRSILSKLTHNRVIAMGVGAFVTMIIQSSSATTVMLVGFVQSGLMRFAQTIGVMLGAAIGTTITAQIIAFKLTDYSLIMVGVGAFVLFFAKPVKLKNLGETVLGFGLLFFGMYVMSEAMYPLRSYEPFTSLLLQFENPVTGILAGALFTALIQSSSASIGILIILASQGLLSLEAAIPLVMGANFGTAITAVLASLNTNREAKKVAIAHVFIKLTGLVLVVWWIPYFTQIVKYLSPGGNPSTDAISAMAEAVPRQIANAHTVFNIILATVMLPFTALLAKIINRILPQRESREVGFTTMYLDKNIVNTPALALNLAKQEVLRMAVIVQEMVGNIIRAFLKKDDLVLSEIMENEKEVDFLRDGIKDYLVRITRENIQEERVNEAFQLLYTVKELEQVADLVSTNLSSHAKKWIACNADFSDQGRTELTEYHIKVMKQLSRAIEVVRDVNLEKALVMKEKYKKYADMAREFERYHFERLQADVHKSV
ncbi:MAG: Na/Pi cotransporter family protein, partial [Bacteroidetes bacterium]|nr:Na/Pi cotransporter family protein [Bacteroidota bacterium]